MSRYGWFLIVLVMLAAGSVLKGLAVPDGRADLAPEAQSGRFAWPRLGGEVVTVYFPEPQSGHLFPVARRVAAASPRAALEELFAGPAPGRQLAPAVPPGVRLTDVRVTGSAAEVAVEGGPLPSPALTAIARTLGVERLRVNGKDEVRVEQAGTRLYFMQRGMPLPVLLPGQQLSPRESLERLLTMAPPAGVPWLPSGISLDALEVSKGTARVRLRFAPALQSLVESGAWNFAPYYMGVVYTLTEFPEIERVRFEFAGLSPLALKQCRTPLSVALQRPAPENGRAGEDR